MDHNDEGQWFIINTLTQYEKKVREAVQRQITLADPEIPVYEVQFPVEKIVEKRNGKTVAKERKLFPGYVFVRMSLYKGNEGTELNEWSRLKEYDNLLFPKKPRAPSITAARRRSRRR